MPGEKFSSARLLQRNAVRELRSDTRFAQWAGVSSLPVGFAMQHHEISVAWVQTYALQQSERDTAELAKNASQGDVNSLKQNGITSLCLSSP